MWLLDKIDNCQARVFVSYIYPKGYAIIDKRFYIPKNWFNNKYKEKKQNINCKKTLYFKTKLQLAMEMLRKIIDQNILSFKYVLADTIYEENPDFI